MTELPSSSFLMSAEKEPFDSDSTTTILSAATSPLVSTTMPALTAA